MKPRVAIVLPYFGSGGAENMVSRLASNIDLSKIDVEVICIYGKPMNNRLEEAVAEHGVSIKYIGKDKGFSLCALKRLNRELSDFNPDIIHTHLSACVYCSPWVLFHKATMLHTIHNTPQFELIKPKIAVMRVMYKLGKAVPVAISNEIQNMVSSFYNLKRPAELVYNPVDVAKYHVPKQMHDEIVLVTVGRLSVQKNQLRLIKVFERLSTKYSKLVLIILGDGPLRGKIERHIKDHDLDKRILLMGNVDNVEEYFAGADIFVLSSDYEGLPLVVLEAMAGELPIVSTDVGGIKDIVSENGILVPVDDENAFEDALDMLISNSELRHKMGRKSLSAIAKYDSAVIARVYVELYIKYTKRG